MHHVQIVKWPQSPRPVQPVHHLHFLNALIWTHPSFGVKNSKWISPVSPILTALAPVRGPVPWCSSRTGLPWWPESFLFLLSQTNPLKIHPFLFLSDTHSDIWILGWRQTDGSLWYRPPPSDSDTVQSLCGGHIGHLCPVPQSGHSLHSPPPSPQIKQNSHHCLAVQSSTAPVRTS